MLVVMAVALYTSRVILNALGVVDFGIFSLVSGLSSAFIFFSSSLTNSIQRYLTFEIGRGDYKALSVVFNTSIWCYLTISLVCFIISLLFAPYIVENYLNIPNDKIGDSILVLILFVFQLALTLFFSVYESILIARENMKFYAYIGLFDALSKLIVAYLIVISSNRLVFYATASAVVYLAQRLILMIYCHTKYEECKFKMNFDFKTLKGILNLGGWSIYGTATWMFITQGINYIFNIFGGPILNAAMGIANQINHAINNFCVHFYTAVRPQIVKNYAQEKYQDMIRLVNNSGRYSLFLLSFLCMPVFINTDYILTIWLGKYPAGTIELVRLVLLFSMINSLVNPIWTSIMATNRVKKPIFLSSTFFLLTLPISYFLIKNGLKPYYAVAIMCLVRFGSIIIMLKCLSQLVNISILQYIKETVITTLIVFTPVYVLLSLFNYFFETSLLVFIFSVFLSIVFSLLSIFLLGLKNNEKQLAIEKTKSFIKKHKL